MNAQRSYGYEHVAKIGIWTPPGGEHYAKALESTASWLSKKLTNYFFVVTQYNPYELPNQGDIDALDFIFADPALCVQLGTLYNLDPLVTIRNYNDQWDYAVLGGTLFCMADRADLTEPENLAGKKLISTYERSLSDWISILREFQDIGLSPGRDFTGLFFADTPEAVASAVKKGTVDAGCVAAGVLERMADDGQINAADFKVLTFKKANYENKNTPYPFRVSTRLYPEWTLMASPTASDRLVENAVGCLLADDALRKQVPGIGWVVPRNMDKVHKCLQEMKKYPYENFGVIRYQDVIMQYRHWLLGFVIALGVLFVVAFFSTIHNRVLVSREERMREEQDAMMANLQRMEFVASMSKDWIWECDREGRFTYSNGMIKEMMGYEAEEIIWKFQHDLFTNFERKRIAQTGRRSPVAQDGVFRERYEFLSKQGRVVVHECTSAPIPDYLGKMIGFRGVNRDVTSQIRSVNLG